MARPSVPSLGHTMQHTGTRLAVAIALVVAASSPACGSDNHPAGVGDELSSGGAGADVGASGNGGGSGKGGSSGTGAGTSHGGTTGGGADGSGLDGGDGVDGSVGAHGGGGRSGAAGRSSTGGESGAGGMPLTDAGRRHDPYVDAGRPVTPGSIGTGSVPCDGTPGNACGSGAACCAKSYAPARECVMGFTDCSCYAEGSCPLLGCDGPEDCPGAKCCATVTMDGNVGTTWCKSSCESAELEVCKAPSDCSASDAVCLAFGAGILTCN